MTSEIRGFPPVRGDVFFLCFALVYIIILWIKTFWRRVMKFFDKMERKVGRFAIPHLPIIMTGLFLAGYIFYFFFEKVYPYFTLNPAAIVENHQYWRLISWVLTIPFQPSDTFSYLLIPIALYFYYYVGTSLEAVWGKFMLNLYIFGQIIFMDIAVLVTYAIKGDSASLLSIIDAEMGWLPTTRYLLLGMFLAMSVIFSDVQVRYAFVIPMKMKWLALIDLAFMLYEFIKYDSVYRRVIILCCALTFLIFYLINRGKNGRSLKQIRRSRQFKKAYERGRRTRENEAWGNSSGQKNGSSEDFEEPAYGNVRQGAKIITMRPTGKGPIHRCAVCGRTEQDDPDLEFRYCSKCAGSREYCSDHLYTHVHVEEE